MRILATISFLTLLTFQALAQSVPEPGTGTAPSETVLPAPPRAVISFKEAFHDFGDIKQGDRVTHSFEFLNSGQMPLVISNVQTTCGCTASEWTKDPVLPGKTGQIKATFNSAGRQGLQRKVITVYSNASNAQEMVTLVTNVLPGDGK